MPVRLAPNEEPLPGYRLIERLGRGGFGEVWKAEAPGGLHKAIKFVFGDLDSQSEDGRPAEQELKALNRVKAIRHPYILSIEQYQIVDGQLMIVMELADRNLWDRFRECRNLGMPGVPRGELLGYLAEAAEALDLMNERYHIQHLDVKPQNLFLIFNHVKVADFGLAKDFEGVRGTITGGVTPVYAGPETFEGYVSRFTDQYSLAIVFQELLTGTRPFNGGNTKQLVMQHLTGRPDLDPLPPADRGIIGRALEKKPEARWPSCTELVRMLRQSGAGAAPSPGSAAVRMPPARTPVPSALANQPTAAGTVGASTAGSAVAARAAVARGPVPPGEPTPSVPLPPLVAPGGSSVLVTPRLVTPRLVTPATAAGDRPPMPSPAATLARPQVVQTGRMSSLGLAAPERNGDGVLLPALFVGVGQTGLLVIRAIKRLLRDRFGPDPLPHVRFLYVDTDPDGSVPLPPQEVVLARLHRPAHYLQAGGPSVEGWLPPGALYKLPRNPGPAAGVRAYGRLALADNYRTVAQRVRQEAEAFVTDDAIDKAAARTGLGLRSNRARAYVVAGLAGGTGGGMAVDLAYLVKAELRQIGYAKPECVGVLLVPPADKTASRGLGLANTFAALTELAHFHAGRNRYTVRFDPAEPPVSDGDGPFARTAVVPLPRRADPKEQAKTAGLVARMAFLDLFTPVGRVTDAVRAEAFELNRAGTPVVQAFGLYRLSWPRTDLLAAATRKFVGRVIQRWVGKEGAHLREPIGQWLDGEWKARGLELETVVERFDQAVVESLREQPDRVFDAFIDPLAQRGAGRAEPEAAVAVLEQILKVVGRPEAEGAPPGSLAAVLAERYKKVSADAEGQMAALAVAVIEHPQYRLPGAEEALAQIEERLARTVDGLAAVRDDLARDVRETYARLFPLIGGLAGGLSALGTRKATLAETVELLRQYPRKRLRLLVLDVTLSLYRGLQAAAPECQRDLNLCRTRLTEIGQAIAAPDGPPAAGPGRMILPHGVEGLDGAADQFLAALPPDDLVAFDTAVQAAVKAKFKRLTDVCIKPAHAGAFRELLAAQAREFLDARLERADPAAMFFRHRQDEAAQRKMLAQAFEGAAPDLTAASGRPQTEAPILAAPAGPDGDRFRAEAEAALPGAELIPAPLPDDIVFVREYPLLPLHDLPHLTGYAREAYEAQLATGDSPHARADIPWAT
jgi:hypothetical protein